mmetsp:Transcript_19126/g.41530  ORF Transcript_19126/g.41530 Transcript_19126/m.41530 type:complete len:226 (+) Transcript_19126:1781-2458(+)
MLLPGHFMDEANLFPRGRGGSHVAVKHVCLVDGVEIFDGLVFQFIKHFGGSWLVNVVPIHVFRRFRSGVENNELVLWRATGIFTGRHLEGVAVFCLGYYSFIVGLFVFEKFLVCHIPVNRGRVRNSELVDTNFLAGIFSSKSLRHIVRITRFGIIVAVVPCQGALLCPLSAAIFLMIIKNVWSLSVQFCQIRESRCIPNGRILCGSGSQSTGGHLCTLAEELSSC